LVIGDDKGGWIRRGMKPIDTDCANADANQQRYDGRASVFTIASTAFTGGGDPPARATSLLVRQDVKTQHRVLKEKAALRPLS
jgi:hypothetical protein